MPVPAPGSAPSDTRPSRPPQTSLDDIAAASGASEVASASSTRRAVTGVDLRAQDIRDGDLFAALPGSSVHGATFVADALERGAAAVLTDPAGLDIVRRTFTEIPVPVLVHDAPRAVLGAVSALVYGNPSEHMTVIGITGTSGKTTTSYLLEAALTAAGKVTGLIGTIETKIAGSRVPSALTTPEAPRLHALFAVMREQGIDTVVMEVSSHALSLGRVDGTVFSVGAFTNLSQDHLDFHDSLEDYFQAKARLFAADSSVHTRSAAVCVDDVWGKRMAEIALSAGSAVVTASVGAESDWTVADAATNDDGSQSFTVVDPSGERHPASIRLPGRYNVANAVLAAAVCAAAGVDVDRAIAGMAAVDVPGRVQRIERGQDFLAVVDYAHKPAAVEAVIETLRAQSRGRIAVVLGAGGDRDTGKRALMGAAGARGADLLVVTDDNPRSEDPAAIREAVASGALAVDAHVRGEVRNVGGRADAIAEAVQWAQAGDVVLVAGKGHETGQEVAGVKHPFDDRQVLADAIDRRIHAESGVTS
ncbi:UDP-N-acetylmuramoyl-L-alanyl-D-glutamate--2,6-diaminopimelate ligase [Rhodococcus kyotonensis]|uniref:UDP-N-acetylmuramoyl-L-alanyl-D-glutamate--2,6-diaminopimelate ligase n=1 Tax=Rhodococcoides kyotonense TaxID=398843 RepID=A0A177YP98_9NOCA|nr:UDP-N-acetylmuramoyl-L-alanyl-D-glutamate--2,6-diaminopimelate ligase [Rhodococcus kyotonensis]OAK57417.1 UDP-N-acetylmuramoyl-L-alanyl-D-glutamate--2,6-diaminopimelate ligase [Rhodococcus kyotonensis]